MKRLLLIPAIFLSMPVWACYQTSANQAQAALVDNLQTKLPTVTFSSSDLTVTARPNGSAVNTVPGEKEYKLFFKLTLQGKGKLCTKLKEKHLRLSDSYFQTVINHALNQGKSEITFGGISRYPFKCVSRTSNAPSCLATYWCSYATTRNACPDSTSS